MLLLVHLHGQDNMYLIVINFSFVKRCFWIILNYLGLLVNLPYVIALYQAPLGPASMPGCIFVSIFWDLLLCRFLSSRCTALLPANFSQAGSIREYLNLSYLILISEQVSLLTDLVETKLYSCLESRWKEGNKYERGNRLWHNTIYSCPFSSVSVTLPLRFFFCFSQEFPRLFHHYLARASTANKISSCFGCTVKDMLSLCHNSSFMSAGKIEPRIIRNQSTCGWFSTAIKPRRQYLLHNKE